MTFRAAPLALAGAILLAACGDDPTSVEFQVIEETEFAPSLGIDLSQMTKIASGVYRQDLVAGTGADVELGTTVTVAYTGWLSDGTQFDSGEFTFLMGNNEVIRGFEEGLIGAKVGGTRLLVIPPGQAYGAAGSGPIPPGAIVVFEVEILDAQ